VRIALDVTSAVKPRKTGIGWFITHLVGAMCHELGPDDRLLLCTRLSRWKKRRHRPRAEHPQVAHRWFEPLGPRGGADLYHGLDKRLTRGSLPKVVTIHDVFSLVSDRFADERFRSRTQARYAEIARCADRIVFPSACSEREFLGFQPEANGRTAVVPHGVDPAFRPSEPDRVADVRRRYGLPERFALYVGEISLRKNLPGMARGLAAAEADLPWVWVGSDAHGAVQILDEVRAVPGLETIRLGYVPFADLPAVYGAATLLTFVTHHEGFGLPALEAMACGTPAVVSSRGALPEVTAGCALEATPDEPTGIGEAVRRIARDGACAAELRRRGMDRAATFTWQRAARGHLAVYRDVLAAKR
jgi:glycosyltransferase involved in cell wall biosynthesis